MQHHLPLTHEEEAWRLHHVHRKIPSRHYAHGTPRHLARRAIRRKAFARPVHGFDVSSYQPAAPDFRQGGRSFAIWKATEGTGYFDPHFLANRRQALAQGLLLRGIYHFARPASHSPEAEARFFLDHVGPRWDREVAVLDFEVSPWSVPWIVRWLQVVQAAGWPTEFYSYLGMLSANPTAGIPETGTGLWVAAYGSREPGNDRWAYKDLWQHTDGAGSVPGNDGQWDCSEGDADVLSIRAGGSAPPPAPIPRRRASQRVPYLTEAA